MRFHVDVNVGDPIWPEPLQISLPRLIDGAISARGYPLEMVLAEKIVTALERGTANARWRDFVDVYVLTRRCHRPAYWSQGVIGIMEPLADRHIGAI